VNERDWLILGGLVIVNAVAYGQMWLDKRRAERRVSRISERRLLVPVLFGGLPGLVLGMHRFRHKTRKGPFKLKLAGATAVFAVLLHVVADWP